MVKLLTKSRYLVLIQMLLRIWSIFWRIGCGGYYRAVKSHMEYGIKVIDSAELVSISITLAPSSAEYYVSRKEKKND